MSSRSSLLRASAAATLLLANAALPAAAGPAPALALAPDAGTAAGAKATVPLKHLPAGRDELMFRGESAHRSWSVYLGRGETERAKTFQLALKNAVAALPDQSSVRLSINGRVVANVPTRSPNSVAIVPVAIPPGLLVPGFNKVDVSTVMLHRVDCSVAASYELWTELDPAQTGFLVPAVPASAVRSIEDVAAEPLADDGTARIHLRSADYDDAAGLARAGRLITALVRRAGLARPVVDVGPEAGRGPGVDVVLATGKAGTEASRNLRILGREDDVTFARDPASERLVLLLSGADAADLDRQVDAFAAKGARLAPAAPVGEMAVEGETRRSFADLGLQTEAFSGRHYAAAIDVVLPSDFYPANYDRAQVRIDGTYARNLDPDNALVFRVNGALVSSLHLGPDREGVLDHDLVELPLRFFHPGHNAITFEAATTTPADRQCDTASLQRDVRFTLGGTSEIAFPRFAHLGTVPQIPGAMAGSGRGGLNLYLSQTDAATVGAGLTMLANIGARGGELRTPVLHVNPPAPSDAPGIVVGALDVLPAALAGPVRALTTSPEADAAPEAAGRRGRGHARGRAEQALRPVGFARQGAAPAAEPGLLLRLRPGRPDAALQHRFASHRRHRPAAVRPPAGRHRPAAVHVRQRPMARRHGVRARHAPGRPDASRRRWPMGGPRRPGRQPERRDGGAGLGAAGPRALRRARAARALRPSADPGWHRVEFHRGQPRHPDPAHDHPRRLDPRPDPPVGGEMRLGLLMAAALLASSVVLDPAAAESSGAPGPRQGPGVAAKDDRTSAVVSGVARTWFKAQWAGYKARFVTADGRVVDNANGDVSHSEGQGYGLLLAAAADDRDGFALIWRWTRDHLRVRPDALFAWKWDPKRQAVADRNTASDGDILIAWALTRAARRFGRPEDAAEARRIATSLMASAVRPGRTGPVLMPGAAGFGPADQPDGPVVNLSYWIYPALSDFAALWPGQGWEALRHTGLDLLAASRFGPRRLPADWESLAGAEPVPARKFPATFGYDAIRIPLYLAWDGGAPRDASARFADLPGTGDPRVIDVSAGSAGAPMAGVGYRTVLALARCAARGETVPPDLMTTPDALYYPETLRLLSLLVVQERFPQCL